MGQANGTMKELGTTELETGLRRTREGFFGRLAALLGRGSLDEAVWEELEELLIQADVGVPTTQVLLERLRQRASAGRLRDKAEVRQALGEELVALLPHRDGGPLRLPEDQLGVILVVGVNGTGKTTTIAKLAHYLTDRGGRPFLAAADTFRAAAIDQLQIWGERVRAPVIAGQPGADPAAVAYDAWQAAKSRGASALIIDTAGRLHTKYNLMEELRKIKRVIARQDPEAPHEVLLVLDATTGQNSLAQARQFSEAVEVTGVVLAKVDGTAKGGIVFAIAR
ncbi:MAG: signal recognition particle-docking protein FtsY, partial [Chloroflexi bacterium]|nr:signal recognition particle-docking protein FtsY [Chloroflexota bacterium]